MNKAYSNCRFSAKAASQATSHDRKFQLTKEYADKAGLELDDKLTEKWSLKHFLALIEDGTVKPGSILVVENLDRLSRQKGPKASRQLVEQIVDHGVGVYILNLNLTLKKGFEDDVVQSVILDAELARSYQDFSYRSDRIKTAWARRKAETPEEKD